MREIPFNEIRVRDMIQVNTLVIGSETEEGFHYVHARFGGRASLRKFVITKCGVRNFSEDVWWPFSALDDEGTETVLFLDPKKSSSITLISRK